MTTLHDQFRHGSRPIIIDAWTTNKILYVFSAEPQYLRNNSEDPDLISEIAHQVASLKQKCIPHHRQ